jgi:hypothetical protein
MTALARKRRGDLRAARGRAAAIVIALALGAAACVALLHARDRLHMAMSANYLQTQPAHAQLMLAGDAPPLTDSTLQGLRVLPGVTAARAGAAVRTRVQGAEGRQRPALLFVLPTATASTPIAWPHLQHGRWATAADEVMVERDAMALLPAGANTLTLDDGSAARGPLRLVGLVHDAALAPASVEGMLWGYVDAAFVRARPTLRASPFVLLRFAGIDEAARNDVALRVAQDNADRATRAAVTWLRYQGLAVREARVPAPG